MAMKLKCQVASTFKMHGLTLRSDAVKYLQDLLSPFDEHKKEECIERLLEVIQKQPLCTTLVDRKTCEAAVKECNEEEELKRENIFSIIDAFHVPRFQYNNERKKFVKTHFNSLSLFCDAKYKGEMFRERYTILYQRTSRHDLFSPAAIGSSIQSKKFMLKPIEFLLGSTAKLGEIIVLGMLSQMKEGKWYLEDITGAVQLDLSRANFHLGLFTENCFVLAEGWYEDQVFHVNAFGFPPPEPAKTTRAYFGNLNFFGGPSDMCAKASQKLRTIEQQNEEAMFVFLSDVWLDSLKVLKQLRILFTGYAEMPPTCFVLCGNFLSQSYGGKQSKTLKECLGNLSDLLSDFPNLISTSRFVFVPGPQDPGPSHILPRSSLPENITKEFQQKVPTASFVSNPCRIQYCTQEIVIYRDDLVMKMCRNCVRFPSEGEISTHFAKTIIGQSHLCPLPLQVTPIHWSHDNAMRVYPLPDLIVCADKYDPFMVNNSECTIANPGSFPQNDWSFKVYLPASKQVEDSQLEDSD